MKHCLVVDDSNSIRKVARKILQDAGLRVSEADTRRDALDLCAEAMPDCIVLDWQMPDGDAITFLNKLRGLPGGAHPKVIYLTSENDPLQVARVMRSGADVHMMKPFDQAGLLAPLAAAGLV